MRYWITQKQVSLLSLPGEYPPLSPIVHPTGFNDTDPFLYLPADKGTGV